MDQIIYDDRSYLVTIQLSLDDNGVLATSGPVVEELSAAPAEDDD